MARPIVTSAETVKAMILAAGRGERMRPLTDTTPKPLLEVAGETLIERHLARLAAAGFREVVINVSHLGHLIEARLGDGRAWHVDIRYSREPGAPLETAGGIVRALPLLGAEPFLVVNGDIWTDYPFAALAGCRAAAHLVLVANPAHHRAGDFDLEGNTVRRRPQGGAWTYAGIGVYAPGFFAGLDDGPAPLAPLLFAACARGEVSGEVHAGRWLDIGTPERLAAARAEIGAERQQV